MIPTVGRQQRNFAAQTWVIWGVLVDLELVPNSLPIDTSYKLLYT